MKQQNDLIESVFKSMKRDEQLALTETNERRHKFYNTTKQPLHCSPSSVSIFDRELESQMRDTIITLVQRGTGWSEADIESISITSRKPLMVQLDMCVKFIWKREHSEGSGSLRQLYELKTTRPIKFSTVVNNLIKEKEKLFEMLATDRYAFRFSDDEKRVQETLAERRDELTKFANGRVKDITNKIAADNESLWVYFTTFDIYKHYLEIGDMQDLSSCMSKHPSFFGSTYDGEYRHPLQGYEYSPDFRLALLSTYSPDDIRNADEYPFIARAMVFPVPYATHENFAFSRVYGNEIAQRVFKSNALRIEKPEGYIVYGVMCNDYKLSSEYDQIADWLSDRYSTDDEDDEPIKGHMIAPFIDTWNNCLHIVGDGVPFTREDGIKVVELRTGYYGYTQEEEDEDVRLRDSERRNSIHYGTGIVQWHTGERDYTWECYWDGQRWVEGDYDY